MNYPTAVVLHGDLPEFGKPATGYIVTADATIDPPPPPGRDPRAAPHARHTVSPTRPASSPASAAA